MREAAADDQVDVVWLDVGLAWGLLIYLGEASAHERGGVLVGLRSDREVRITGAVFPPQLTLSREHCAFDVNSVEVLRAAVTELADPEITRILGTIVGWVHSHPGHGVFLSTTDLATLDAWVQLDAQAVTVVIDPHQPVEPRRRIAWWNRPGRERYVVLDETGPDAVSVAQAAAVAQALTSTAAPGASWDVVASPGIFRVFSPPRPPGSRDSHWDAIDLEGGYRDRGRRRGDYRDGWHPGSGRW